MEYAWYATNIHLPPQIKSGIEYLATVYSPYWNINFQTKVVTYEKEVRGSKTEWIWKLDGQKIPSTWQVTEWTFMLPPARTGW